MLIIQPSSFLILAFSVTVWAMQEAGAITDGRLRTENDISSPDREKQRKLSDFLHPSKNESSMQSSVLINQQVTTADESWLPLNNPPEQAPNLDIKNEDSAIKVRPQSAPPIEYLNHPFEQGLNSRKRNLQATFNPDPFQRLRIHVDTSSLLKVASSTNTHYQQRIDFLVDHVLPATTKRWEDALRVVPVQGSLRLLGWCPESPSEHIRKGVDNADIILYVSGNGKYCQQGTLAYASACELDQYDRPIAGSITFCLDTVRLGHFETTVDTAVHEVAHILAFSDLLMPYFRKPETGEPLTARHSNGAPIESIRKCIDGSNKVGHLPSTKTIKEGVTSSGARFFEVVTPRVAIVSRNQFNCQRMEGARLENQPTSKSCFGAHWDERLFFGSTMSALAGATAGYLDPVTLALFEDSGWYKADYSVVEVSPFGHGAGCNFVYNDCIVKGQVPNYSKGYFCNSPLVIRNELVQSGVFSCDHSHRSIAMCDMVDVTTIASGHVPPEKFRYFSNSNVAGLMQQTDYCPVPALYNFYCTDSDNANTNSALQGEYFGSDSKCFNTDKQGIPMCLKSHCNKYYNMVEIIVGEEVLRCKYDFEKIYSPALGRTVECPRKSAICPSLFCPANCAGRGVCNFSSWRPTCQCFDQSDTPSMGCFENKSKMHTQISLSSESFGLSLAMRSSSGRLFTKGNSIASVAGTVILYIMLLV